MVCKTRKIGNKEKIEGSSLIKCYYYGAGSATNRDGYTFDKNKRRQMPSESPSPYLANRKITQPGESKLGGARIIL